MDKKKPQIPFRLRFARRKNIRQITTDESKLGAEKSGATRYLIMKSLRAPARLLNRIPASTRPPTSHIAKKRKAWGVLGALILVAIVACSQTARKGYRAAGQSVETAAKDTSNAIRADASAADRWVSDKTAHSSSADNETSAKVAEVLLSDPQIETTDLTVDTAGNVVTLHGSIASEVENQRAEQIARNVLGSVYEVDDQLKVG